MGRYYNGDIEGKFMFAVQESNAADRFGVIGRQPNEIYYYFSEDDLKTVEDELARIDKEYGKEIKQIVDYFKDVEYYRIEEMAEKLGMTKERLNKCLSEYADYNLGCKIRDCIKERGQCEFTGEMY